METRDMVKILLQEGEIGLFQIIAGGQLLGVIFSDDRLIARHFTCNNLP
jgi:hypothetical protein